MGRHWPHGPTTRADGVIHGGVVSSRLHCFSQCRRRRLPPRLKVLGSIQDATAWPLGGRARRARARRWRSQVCGVRRQGDREASRILQPRHRLSQEGRAAKRRSPYQSRQGRVIRRRLVVRDRRRCPRGLAGTFFKRISIWFRRLLARHVGEDASLEVAFHGFLQPPFFMPPLCSAEGLTSSCVFVKAALFPSPRPRAGAPPHGRRRGWALPPRPRTTSGAVRARSEFTQPSCRAQR